MKLDTDKFLFLFQNEFEPFKKDSQRTGLVDLLGFIQADEKITDNRWAAYMLATAYHETAKTWQPIEEYGKGAGKKYGIPDPHTGKAYYGRGYVQLTWAENYGTMGKVFGLDFLNEPELVMRPEVAYKIMSYGMRKGSFTGVGLSKYIAADKCDLVNARKIINGLDCAERIAGYAEKLISIIEQSEVE